MNYRELVEVVIGRKLLPTELVHHRNGNHNDNRIDNMYVFKGRGKHLKYHIMFGTLAMRLINCYDDECILNYVKKVLIPAIKKSNVDKLMRENDKNEM